MRLVLGYSPTLEMIQSHLSNVHPVPLLILSCPGRPASLIYNLAAPLYHCNRRDPVCYTVLVYIPRVLFSTLHTLYLYTLDIDDAWPNFPTVLCGYPPHSRRGRSRNSPPGPECAAAVLGCCSCRPRRACDCGGAVAAGAGSRRGAEGNSPAE